jgi:hypothetical protein
MEISVGVPVIKTGISVNQSAPVLILGQFKLLDDASTVADGALNYTRWNNSSNHTPQYRGLIDEMAERVREIGPRIDSGVQGNVTITTNGGSLDGAQLGITAGAIYTNLHKVSTIAYPVPNEYYVVNDSVAPYKKITDLNEITLDANGDSLRGNGDRYGLSFAVTNSSEGGGLKIYVFLPTGHYNTDSNAINDIYGYSGVNIELEEQFTIVRVCRVVLKYTSGSGGTLENLLGADAVADERNQPIGVGGGGGCRLYLGWLKVSHCW